ncbi:hypothetical protein [Roseovarius aestuariivivens]|uniref:hypothetical protein n=1 Tax=Roseovarius aestuariivivens TaxID=1888910 RepID=UPI001082111C|nr:hypothetical protein [Roseovarius aestuariivivens]
MYHPAMMSDPRLEEFAKTPNWIAFGKALAAALDDPERFGFEGQSELLAHVAQLRGVDPSSLRNPLAAVNWMKLNAPKALKEENASVPMTGVLVLSQISIISNDLAKSLAPKFFSGETSRKDLQVALRRAEVSKGGRGVAAHERAKRIAHFEEEVFRFLKENSKVLEMGRHVDVVRTSREARVPSDFSVIRDGQIVAAIECKSHRNKRHRRYLVETLAMTALLAKEHSHAVLVVPESWGDSKAELAHFQIELGLDDVRVAEFGDEDGPGRRFRYLEAGSQGE